MKLVLLGLPRTGTMSVWGFFKNHPEISISIPKEYLRMHEANLHGYIERAHFINNNIKVLVDGSPGLFFKVREFKIMLGSLRRQGIFEIVLLYNIRDPIKQLISMIDRRIWAYRKGWMTLPEYITDCFKIKEKEMYDLCKFIVDEYEYLRIIEDHLGKENIYFVKLEEFEKRQKEIFNFLGVSSNVTYKFPICNSTWELGFNTEQLKVKIEIVRFVEKHMDTLNPIIKENQKKRKERYGI